MAHLSRTTIRRVANASGGCASAKIGALRACYPSSTLGLQITVDRARLLLSVASAWACPAGRSARRPPPRRSPRREPAGDTTAAPCPPPRALRGLRLLRARSYLLHCSGGRAMPSPP